MRVPVPLCGEKDGSRHVDHLAPGWVKDTCWDGWRQGMHGGGGWRTSWEILGSRTVQLVDELGISHQQIAMIFP